MRYWSYFRVSHLPADVICRRPHYFRNTIERNILEVGVGGNPKVGGFSNLGFYQPGQRIGDPFVFATRSPLVRNFFFMKTTNLGFPVDFRPKGSNP